MAKWENLLDFYNSRSFARRVKRLVKVRLLNIDIIVVPHWKHLCKKEITNLGYECVDLEPSVLRTQGKIGDVYRLALWLRTASRVCVSLPSFRADSVKTLRRKMGEIPWDVWINPTVPLHFYVNVEYSKLRHEGMVKDIAIDTVFSYFSRLGFDITLSGDDYDEKRELSRPRQRIWINVFRNICEIRLDMVGANLYQRGYRVYPGFAPIRETLASAILEAAGWTGNENLIDGMTGSGTFAIEAVLKARNIPPGYFRSFLFEQQPSFQSRMWGYEKRQCERNFINEVEAKIVAIDRDSRMISMAQRNAEMIDVKRYITWMVQNFFELSPAKLGLTPGLLVLNPPYGKRLQSSTRALFKKIAEHLTKNFRGWRIALIVPDFSLVSYFKDMNHDLFCFPHGGLWVYVIVGRIG